MTSAFFDTGFLAILMFFFSFGVVTLDGGNIDFYWKPLIWAWLAFTAFCFLPVATGGVFIFVRRAWWLQILMPMLCLPLAVLLVGVYKPCDFRPRLPAVTPSPSR